MTRLLIMIAFIAVSAHAMDPAYQKALDDAVKQCPPGDYNTAPVRRFTPDPLSVQSFRKSNSNEPLPPVISKSSDGKYEIRPISVMDSPRPDVFDIALFDAKTGAKVSDLPGRYDISHGSEWISLWHPTLPVVAIDVPDARRFGHLEVFSLVEGKRHRLSVPDYPMNALGRVNAISAANTCFSKLLKWNKNDLQLNLQFNARNETTGEFQGFYTSKVTLGLDELSDVLVLKSITPPKEP